ncbi:hypothetical protein UMZ34_17450 [Halopseudomonas pachastrellae]|nr:hypothetical protein UMZ34_17450 [Halopseudomonas pachastrellae]
MHGAAAHWLGEWLNSPSPAGALGYLRDRGLLDELQASLEADVGGQAMLRIELRSADAEPAQLLAGLDGWLQAMRSRDPAEWPQAARRALAQTAFDLGPQGDMLDSCRRYADRLLTLPAEQVLDVAGVGLPTLGMADWQQLLSQLSPRNRLLLQRLPRLLGGEQCAHTGTRWQAHALPPSRRRPPIWPDGWAPVLARWPRHRKGCAGHRCARSASAPVYPARRRIAHPAGLVLGRSGGNAGRAPLAAGLLVATERGAGALGRAVGVCLQWSLAPGQLVLDIRGPQSLLPSFVRELMSQLQAPPAFNQRAFNRNAAVAAGSRMSRMPCPPGVCCRRWSRNARPMPCGCVIHWCSGNGCAGRRRLFG